MTPRFDCPRPDDWRQWTNETGDPGAVADHLDGCPACAAAVDAAVATDPVARALTCPVMDTVPDAVAAAVTERVLRAAGRDPAVTATHAPVAAAADPIELLAPPDGPEEIGRLGGFRVRRVLGVGGMGAVFLADDEALGRPVALKVMRAGPGDGVAAARFLREARSAAALRHDHVVTVYQVGEAAGRAGRVPFLAMELLAGESLEARLRRAGGPLPVAEVARIGREAALGLAAAHAAGLVHRDVKPDNLWLEAAPGGTRVKVLDFGLARGVDPAADAGVTTDGLVVGTPAYMSPEQAAGRPVDARSDLFGLGCTLYRMATGAAPFAGADVMTVLNALATHRPPPARRVNPAVPKALSALIDRLLEKDPADRPPAAGAVAAALAAAAAPPRRTAWPAVSLALAGVTAALCGVVIVVVRHKDGTVTTHNVEPGRPVTVAPAPGDTVTIEIPSGAPDEWVAGVRKLSARQQVEAVAAKLRELNPKHDGAFQPVIANGVVTELETSALGMADLTPLRALTGLTRLVCEGGDATGAVTDLRPLRGLPLEHLNLSSNNGITDLSPLAGMPLRELLLYGTHADDLTALRGMKTLRVLHVPTTVKDLSPLKGLLLDFLHLNDGPVADLSPLAGMPLTVLKASNTPLRDLTPLKGMPLRELHLHICRAVTDVSPLAGAPLEVLDLRDTGVTDFAPLRTTKLVALELEPERLRAHRAVLAAIPTLTTINETPAADVWRALDAAPSPKP